jgi:hypothetical protein
VIWPPRGSHRVGATRFESGPPRGGNSSWAVRRRTPARGLRRAERSSIAFRSCSRGSACDRSGEGEGGSRASAALRLAGSPGRGNSEKAGAPIGARAPGPIVEGEESDRGPLRKGLMRSFSVNRAAWHAVTSPESPGGEGFAKGRHRWVRSPRARRPTAREARLQGRFAYRRDVPPGRIRLSGNRAGGRVRAREPGAQRTPSGTRRHSSFAGSVVRGIGHVAFASDGLGKGRGRREVVLPLHPRRAEVDARAEASPNRASRGSPPWRSHRQEGVGRTRRAARWSHAP